ncbi:MAG: hypothetical protein IJW55_02850 [Clostridia bacterium]|nr:hypothetical protein [Clostridia bacterium]
MRFLQLDDKDVRIGKIDKSFRPPFSKGGAVEGAEPSSRSAEREIPHTAFSFVSFSLAPLSCKRKAAKVFLQFNKLLFFEWGQRSEETAVFAVSSENSFNLFGESFLSRRRHAPV